MIFVPFGVWFRGLLALAMIGASVYLLLGWADRLPREEAVEVRQGDRVAVETRPLETFRDRVGAWRPGWDAATALLAGGAGLMLWNLGGSFLTPKLWLRRGGDEPRHERGGERTQIRRPDGAVLNVEFYGPPDAPPIVLTHGWGGDATEWNYLKKDLGSKYRLIAWDLPGLGLSTEPGDRDYSLERMAHDLEAVLELAGGRPAVLLGHSIGGMIILTFCKLFPEALGSRVSGLVLVHTTDTNPVFTKVPTWLLPAIQKPVLEPLCHLSIALAPVVRLLHVLSYLNGSAHWSNHRGLFAGTETKGDLEFVTRYMVKASPAVVARGTLGMFRYDATDAPPRVTVPTLVVSADKDTTTVPEASERIALAVPGARLVTLAPARHMGLLERRTEFSRAVDQFCEGIVAPAGRPEPLSAVGR
ncbi:alpha/beta fold hydrolase [Gemmata sp.]|uniref:alpha/beta fold hydrolase n=1 Tax=Gemmata sp. TaxID=1914242 RepID=UPI003F6F8BFA